MELNIYEDVLHRINENLKFTIGDLTHLLSMLPNEMEVKFSVLLDKGLFFTQDENLIFTISCDSEEDRRKRKFFLRIVTNSKPHIPKM